MIHPLRCHWTRGQRIRSTTVFITEAEAYAILLIGNAPQSEPFRKWKVNEGVIEGNFGMYLKLFGLAMARIHSCITVVVKSKGRRSNALRTFWGP